jgi:copper(I)-binding protein
MRSGFAALGAVLSSAALGAALAVVSAAPAQAADHIQVRNAWIPLPPKGLTTGVAYMDIVNGAPITDRLVGAACSCAAKVELHTMAVTGGVMRMRPLPDGLEIRPSAGTTLSPDGVHLMLMGLKQPLRPGEPVPLTLQFAHGGKVTVEALVKAPPGLGGE